MDTRLRRIYAVAATRRVPATAGVLVGLPAIGVLAGLDVLVEIAVPLVYAYLALLDALGVGFPGPAVFWIGLTLFCLGVAAAAVAVVDRLLLRLARLRRALLRRAGREVVSER